MPFQIVINQGQDPTDPTAWYHDEVRMPLGDIKSVVHLYPTQFEFMIFSNRKKADTAFPNLTDLYMQ